MLKLASLEQAKVAAVTDCVRLSEPRTYRPKNHVQEAQQGCEVHSRSLSEPREYLALMTKYERIHRDCNAPSGQSALRLEPYFCNPG